MAIDMTTVKEIRRPGPVYKKKIYLTNSAVIYKGTSTPCPVEITIYSKTPFATAVTSSNLFTYLTDCGYTTYTTNNRYFLIVDNPYEFVYNDGTNDCVFSNFNSQSAWPILMWFQKPDGTSVGSWTNWSITEDAWQLVGSSYTSFTYQYTRYAKTSSSPYSSLTLAKNYITNEEYISNYCLDGVSYPNVTITSKSGNTYTLSDGRSYTLVNYSSTMDATREVKKIQDGLGNTLWQKVTVGWHTVWEGTQRIGNGGSSSFTFGNVPFVDGLKFRVTFTSLAAIISSGDSGSRTYVPSNQTSPYEVTIVNNATTLLQASAYNSSHQSNASATMIYLKTTGDITASYSYRDSFASAYYIVTKIEAYY